MKNNYIILQRSSIVLLIAVFLLTFSATLYAQQPGVQQGVLRIKVSDELAAQLENARMQRTGENVVLTGITSLDRVNVQYKVTAIRRVFRHAGKFEEKHRQYGLHRWYEVEMDKTVSVLQALSTYQSIERIEKAEPIYEKSIVDGDKDLRPLKSNLPQYIKETKSQIATLPGTSNDPFLNAQWHYSNTGQTGGTPGADIKLLQAWSIETGASDVIVAVTDGGIQVDHPDLAANMWVNTGEIPGNNIDDDNNGYIDDINGYGFGDNTGFIAPDDHGTHVGGTIAATTNNGIGVAGVAGGSGVGDGVRLMSCAAFGANNIGGFPETYVYAADNGAVISQNSWGYQFSGVVEEAVLDGIDYFIAEAGKDAMGNQVGPMNGGIVIFAAGNSNSNADWYPGFYDGTLAVAATTHEDKKAYYSNYGPWVDIAAPGGETINVAQQGIASTVANSQYAYFQGTSMACPHVSGVAGLILSRDGGPGFTPQMLRARLVQTTDNIDAVNPQFVGMLGSGRLNAFATLQSDDSTPPSAVDDLAAVDAGVTSISLTWTSPADAGNGSASSYDLRYSTSPIDSANFGDAMPVANLPAPKAAGSAETFTVAGLLPGTTYYFAITSSDFFGNTSGISNVVAQATDFAPQITVSPDTLIEDLQTAQVSVKTFSISNTGQGSLQFAISSIGPGSFATVSPATGTVAADSTMAIEVTFNASNLLDGSYLQDLILASNDPLNDTLIVSLLLHVTGNGVPIASVKPDTVDFGGAFIGGSVSETITIHNAGSDSLYVINVASDNPDFTSDFSGVAVVPPFADEVVVLTYSPSTLGVSAGVLTIHTNDPADSVLYVALIGEGLDAPGIDVSPDSLHVLLHTGNSTTQLLTVQNTGASNLDISVNVTANVPEVLSVKQLALPAKREFVFGNAAEKQTPSSFRRSSSIKLKSVTTLAASTKVLIVTPDDDVSDLAAILNGFDDIEATVFPKASLPGITLADLTGYDIVMTTNNTQWLESGSVSPVVIGDLLADYLDQGGKVIVNEFAYSYDAWKMDGRFITEQYGPFTPSTTDENIFVELGTVLAPGHPVMQGVDTLMYSGFVQNVGLAPGATALAAWSNGELFLAANQQVVALNLLPSLGNGGALQWEGDLPTIYQNAIHWLAGPSYITVNPTIATLLPGEQINLEVTLDASGLTGGFYSSFVNIHTNVPGSELVFVPVLLEVLGPEFTVTPDSLVEELEKGETSVHTLVLQNNGFGDQAFEVSVRNLPQGSSVVPVLSVQQKTPAAKARIASLERRQEPFSGKEADITGTSVLVNSARVAQRSGISLLAATELYATGFENFALGDVTGQEDWFGQFGNWTIESANASGGTQHFRGLSDGLGQSLAFSPQVAVGSEDKSTTTMKLNVLGTGVTWQIIPQSPTAGFLNTRVQFGPGGGATALVSDGAGGGVYLPINAAVPAGYFDLTIEVDRATAMFDIYFNEEKVFTGQGFAGDIEQVVILSLMEVDGPTLDIDDFQILDGQKEFLQPFLSVSPVSGVLGAGESVELTVTFDATSLAFGTYYADIVIDIAGIEQLEVPAVLMVVGDPAIEVAPTVLQAVVDYKEDTIKHFEIRNTGGRPLNYSMQVIGADTDVSMLTADPVQRSAAWEHDKRIVEKLAEDNRMSRPSETKTTSVELLTGTSIFQEGFESATFPPAGWNVVDNEGTGVVWGFSEDFGEGNYCGTGKAAMANSDAAGAAEFDTELITPVISTAGFKNVALQFNASYQNFANLDFLDVDILVTGTTSWVNILRWNEDHGGFYSTPGEFVSIMLDEYLAGATSFRLRWHYYDPNTGDWDWYAQIDDVVVLGDPRTWLTVSPASGTVPVGGAADIVAHFDAADIDAGFYVAGILVNSNAVKNPLVGVVASLEVLAPAVIDVAPDSLYQELMVGESATQTLTITNSGESALKYSIGRSVKASLAQATERRVPSETRTAPVKGKLILDDPSAIRHGGVSQQATTSLYATGFEEFATGDINTQEGWIGQYGNWTIESDNAFEGSRHFHGLSDGLGQSLAFSPQVTVGTESISSATMMVDLDNAGTTTWQIIPQSITAGLVNTRFQVSPDGTLQALVQDSLGAVFANINATVPSGYFEFRIDVIRASSVFSIFFNGQKVFTGQGFAGDIEQVVILSPMETNGPVFDVDNLAILDGTPEQHWLLFNPDQGVVPSGSSVDITLTFNTGDLEEGVYTDVLSISSNDPEKPLTTIPVVFNVMDNDPPVLAKISNASVIETGTIDLTFTATDEDDSIVTVTLLTPPPFVSLSSAGNGTATYSVNPAIGDAGQYPLTVVAEDARGEVDSASFMLTVIPYGVENFSLVNSRTGEVVLDFSDSVSVDVADPDFLQYVIRANTNPKKVGSVVFKFDGKKINTVNQEPYFLSRLVLPLAGAGAHNLSATAYTGSRGKGTRGKSEDAVVHIVNSATVTAFEVVNTWGNKLMDLTEGSVIDIRQSAFCYFTIVANTTGAGASSVRFELNGKHFHTDNLAPYSMTGDLFGYFLPWLTKPGTYTLTATPYSSLFGLGVPGEPVTVTFHVVRGNANAAARNGNEKSPAIEEEEESSRASFTIYPVPVNDALYIQASDALKGEVELVIHNTQGQVVYQVRTTTNRLKDVPISTNGIGMSKGVYYLQVIDAQRQRQIRKFIKE